MSSKEQIKLAEELASKLAEIEKAEANVAQLHRRRLEILSELVDAVPTAKELVKTAERMAPPASEHSDAPTPESKPETATPSQPDEQPEKPELEEDPDLKPDALTGAAAMDAALAAYDAGIDLATPSQGKMIFGMLGREFKLVSPEDKKAVILGYTNKGYKEPLIASTTKLTKVQAGDLITFLQKAKRKDLDEFLEGVVPF